ncbi:1-acyl-sn-glycerol-3-phosphate acyltransferase [Carboxydothermus islandicus]|uniref:1-acyl-sn-glycerol-3-phosphate acyltransferase n=1 Tax=Carboxydothermus islandicus TaxID=661089 RepID=A0A1L8D0I9_9THEO|nr:lysophospholipid acyltransferase family protein [Carboxydothermus islandicus]GAV24621.1 1-acyl-sn-glycerol-3-phosphate acyltransferase [Carboxydothermus islandicus]
MFYRFARMVARWFMIIFKGMKVEGLENVPKSGPYLVVANHESYFDPVAIGCALPHQVYFMAKKELFDIPGFGLLLKKLGAFPVKRNEVDLTAVKTALKYLKEGKVVGIFPEGTRLKTLGEFHEGAAALALKASVPILPVGLKNTRGFKRCKVVIGKIISELPYDKNELEKGARFLREKVKELL